MEKSKKWFWIFVGVVITGLVVGGYSLFYQGDSEQVKYTGPIEEATLGINLQEISALVWIAEEIGYFIDEGLQLTLQEYPSGVKSTEALINKEVDIAVGAGSNLVSNSFSHPELRILASITKADNTELIARKDRGISKASDLKGKKIGVTPKSSAEFYLGNFLTFNELAIKDIEIVHLGPMDLVKSINKGNIDAAITWPPHSYNIQKNLGDNGISWSGQGGIHFNWIALTREDNVSEIAVERFLKALIEAELFIKNNPIDSKAIVSKRLNVDKKYIEYYWPKHIFEVSIDQSLILSLEDQARWRIKKDLTDATEIPDYLDYIYTDALRKIDEYKVSIIQ